MRRNKKWSAERREKFMQTISLKKNHQNEDSLETFLNSIWNRLSLRQKRTVILSTLENLNND